MLVTYAPAEGATGADTFTYTVRDTSQATVIESPVTLIRMAAPTSAFGPPGVPAGDTWSYLDSGTDPGATWKDVNFDDSVAAGWK